MIISRHLISVEKRSEPARELLFRRILWSLFFLLLIPTYWAIIRYHYTVSPGADTFVHLQTVASNRVSPLHWIYPPLPELFQAFIAFLANAFKLPPTQTYTWIAALAIPFSALSLASLARELYGRRIALLCLVLFTCVSLQPWQTYNDGTVLNIIGIGILFPLFFLWLIRACKRSGKARLFAGMFSFLFFITITYTHHLSTLITLAVLLTAMGIAALYQLVFAKTLVLKFLPLGTYVLAAIAFVFLFLNSPLLLPARSIFGVFIDVHSRWPFLSVHPGTISYPWNSFLFGQDVSGGIVQFGILGLVVLTIMALRSRKAAFGTAMLISWFSIYFVGATVTWSGEPSRLARDLALPGCILAAYGIIWAHQWLRKLHPYASTVFVGAIILASAPYIPRKISYMTSESSLHYFEAIDEHAYTRLTSGSQLTETTVVSPNFFWESVLAVRQPNLKPIPSKVVDVIEPATLFTTSRCLMVVVYKQPVLSLLPTSPNFTDIILGTSYTPVEIFESNTRKITFACRENVAKISPTKTGEMLLAIP